VENRKILQKIEVNFLKSEVHLFLNEVHLFLNEVHLFLNEKHLVRLYLDGARQQPTILRMQAEITARSVLK
jgi:hypothetical protein